MISSRVFDTVDKARFNAVGDPVAVRAGYFEIYKVPGLELFIYATCPPLLGQRQIATLDGSAIPIMITEFGDFVVRYQSTPAGWREAHVNTDIYPEPA